MPGYTAELVINEMKNLSACSEYEHVAALHEAWEDKDSYYLVMECCTGMHINRSRMCLWIYIRTCMCKGERKVHV